VPFFADFADLFRAQTPHLPNAAFFWYNQIVPICCFVLLRRAVQKNAVRRRCFLWKEFLAAAARRLAPRLL